MAAGARVERRNSSMCGFDPQCGAGKAIRNVSRWSRLHRRRNPAGFLALRQGGECMSDRREKMKMIRVAPLAVVAVTLLLAGCGNTIRGMGQDTANAVDATQDAGHRIERAAR